MADDSPNWRSQRSPKSRDRKGDKFSLSSPSPKWSEHKKTATKNLPSWSPPKKSTTQNDYLALNIPALVSPMNPTTHSLSWAKLASTPKSKPQPSSLSEVQQLLGDQSPHFNPFDPSFSPTQNRRWGSLVGEPDGETFALPASTVAEADAAGIDRRLLVSTTATVKRQLKQEKSSVLDFTVNQPKEKEAVDVLRVGPESPSTIYATLGVDISPGRGSGVRRGGNTRGGTLRGGHSPSRNTSESLHAASTAASVVSAILSTSASSPSSSTVSSPVLESPSGDSAVSPLFSSQNHVPSSICSADSFSSDSQSSSPSRFNSESATVKSTTTSRRLSLLKAKGMNVGARTFVATASAVSHPAMTSAPSNSLLPSMPMGMESDIFYDAQQLPFIKVPLSYLGQQDNGFAMGGMGGMGLTDMVGAGMVMGNPAVPSILQQRMFHQQMLMMQGNALALQQQRQQQLQRVVPHMHPHQQPVFQHQQPVSKQQRVRLNNSRIVEPQQNPMEFGQAWSGQPVFSHDSAVSPGQHRTVESPVLPTRPPAPLLQTPSNVEPLLTTPTRQLTIGHLPAKASAAVLVRELTQVYSRFGPLDAPITIHLPSSPLFTTATVLFLNPLHAQDAALVCHRHPHRMSSKDYDHILTVQYDAKAPPADLVAIAAQTAAALKAKLAAEKVAAAEKEAAKVAAEAVAAAEAAACTVANPSTAESTANDADSQAAIVRVNAAAEAMSAVKQAYAKADAEGVSKFLILTKTLSPEEYIQPPEMEEKKPAKEHGPCRQLYVGNIPPVDLPIVEYMLRAIFCHFGSIEEIKLTVDRPFAFVIFDSFNSAQEAVAKAQENPLTCMQFALTCKYAKPPLKKNEEDLMRAKLGLVAGKRKKGNKKKGPKNEDSKDENGNGGEEPPFSSSPLKIRQLVMPLSPAAAPLYSPVGSPIHVRTQSRWKMIDVEEVDHDHPYIQKRNEIESVIPVAGQRRASLSGVHSKAAKDTSILNMLKNTKSSEKPGELKAPRPKSRRSSLPTSFLPEEQKKKPNKDSLRK